MKILVTGDRDWGNPDKRPHPELDESTIRNLLTFLAEHWAFQITLIEGGARGVDTIAKKVGHCLDFNVLEYPAEWDRYGKRAGPIRNQEMLDEDPDFVLAFHDDLQSSKGTRNCVQGAQKRGLPVIVINSLAKAL